MQHSFNKLIFKGLITLKGKVYLISIIKKIKSITKILEYINLQVHVLHTAKNEINHKSK